jgi:UDP-N-acetylglucosamine--N-acetylmuramyl-(pentapeptide) pyrophosphoryl-undecaprenol N-acetylglucosamine transferase
VVWLGNPAGMEATLVPKHGIPMEYVRFGGLRGKGLKTKLTLPLNLLRACWQSLGALRRVRPDVVLGWAATSPFRRA